MVAGLGAAKGDHDDAALVPSMFASKVVLLVNTASLCGFTPQLAALQALHEKYSDLGLVVLGVPCNDFGQQEPWEEERVAEFYQEEYGVTFPVTGKVSITDEDTRHPFYSMVGDEFGEGVLPTWNFHKFLLDRSGEVRGIYPPAMTPNDPEIISAVTQALEE